MQAPFDLSPLLISTATTCAATIATFFLGLSAARAMYEVRGPLRAWIDGVLTLPLVLPPTVVGFFLLLAFGRRGVFGHALEKFGVMIAFSWPATVVAATVVAFPLMYRTSLGALEQVNPVLLQAARTLGASEWVVFRKVQLPLAAPGVLAGTVLAFARAMGEFGATLMLAGNIPGRTQTMPVAIFSAAESGDMRGALVWVVVIVGLSLAIIRLLHYERKIRPGLPLERSTFEGSGSVTLSTLEGRDEASGVAVLEVDVERQLENLTLKISFKTAQGAIGLLGPSGAGKSMTLRMIAGVTTPDRGRIVFNDRVLFDSTTRRNIPAAQRRIGFVFQDYALFPHLTVAENVAFGLRGMSKQERVACVEQHLASLQIVEMADRYPKEISGGQRQRVAIARCMATNPQALLFDEPFAALDPHLRRQTEEQLRKTLRNFRGPVVFVTHDMEEAFRFCTELLVLDRGDVIARGPRRQLFEDPGTVAAARLTGCKNIATAVAIGLHQISVPMWECKMSTAHLVDKTLTHVGFRSHQIQFVSEQVGDNVFPCWLVALNEAPHEMTLYLRLHAAPKQSDPAHLQADVSRDVWRILSKQPQPWNILLDPARLLLLRG